MDRLLVFGGKLIQFSLKESNENRNISLKAKVWSLTDNKSEWENESDIVLDLGGTKSTISDTVSILHARNCLEIKTGFLLPVVILQISPERDPIDYQLFLVGLNLVTKSLTLLQNVNRSDPTCTTTWTDRCESLTALDGPVIFWMKNGSHVMCAPGEENPCRHKPTTLPLEFEPSSILGSCYSRGRFVFVVNVKTEHARAYSVTDTTLICENLPIEHFYSPEYTNIVKIHFVDVNIFLSNSSDATTKPNVHVLQTTLYAVTDEGYLLCFKCGKLLFAIPIGDEIRITCDVELHIFRPFGLNKTLVGVQSDGTVYLIDTAERQVINTWTGVQACHCDDFVGHGCPQLLILKDGFDTKSGWLITDTFSVLIDRLGGDGHHPDTPTSKKPENSASAAIHALQTRLTNDLVVLCEKKREVTCKEKFISRTWQTLQDNLQGRPLFQTKEDPSLIPILNQRGIYTSAGKVPKVEEKRSDKGKVTVTEIWQRVVEGQWVVGVDCITRNSISIQVTLVPVKQDLPFIGSITCSSNQHHCSSQDCRKKQTSIKQSEEISSVHNSHKRPRLSGTSSDGEELFPLIKHSLTCVASLPKFGRLSKVRCHIILQWTDNNDSRQPRCEDCGLVCLSVEDILQDKYNLAREATSDIETSRNLTALSLTQLEVGLKLEGTHPYAVGCLRTWLEERAGFTYRPAYRCYMSDVTSLHLVRIKITDGDAGDQQPPRFTLSARNMEQIAWTLHHLYSSFPDNVLILPDNQEVIFRSLKVAVGNLEKELTYVTSAMKDLNKGNNSVIQEVVVANEKGVDGHVDVEKVRANFAKRKRDFFNNDTQMNSVEDLEQFRMKLETLELDTDRSMIDLACQ